MERELTGWRRAFRTMAILDLIASGFMLMLEGIVVYGLYFREMDQTFGWPLCIWVIIALYLLCRPVRILLAFLLLKSTEMDDPSFGYKSYKSWLNGNFMLNICLLNTSSLIFCGLVERLAWKHLPGLHGEIAYRQKMEFQHQLRMLVIETDGLKNIP